MALDGRYEGLKERQEHSFTFSFSIPAYNCGEYLEDAVQSILDQDFGFEEYIQLILVNDGSTDNTDEICTQYADLYPNNIVYIKQENQGASAARLKGLKHATGRYVNFLDADDKWSKNACREAFRMLSLFPEASFCAAKHLFFGARTGKHPLSYKYTEDALINCLETADCPHLSLNDAFIKRELIKEEYFDHRLKWSEDFLVINRILLNNPVYAVMAKPTYWYRKRDGGGSAIDQSTVSKEWYTNPPLYCHKQLFEDSKKIYGLVLPFIQFTIMYDLQWRLKNCSHHPLSKDEFQAYEALIHLLLQDIEDEIILAQRNLYRDQKLYVLAFKYELPFQELQETLYVFDNQIWWKRPHDASAIMCWHVNLDKKVFIDFMTYENNKVVLEGRLGTLFPQSEVALFAIPNDTDKDKRVTSAKLFDRHDRCGKMRFSQDHFAEIGFKLELSSGINTIVVQLGGRTHQAELHWNKFSRYWPKKNTYSAFGNIIVRPGSKNNILRVEQRDKFWQIRREILFERAALKNTAWRQKIRLAHVFAYRHYGFIHKQNKKQIWLISDRTTLAGDNGEALFAYLQQHSLPNVKTYFVINRDSVDYARLKKIGPTIAFNSAKHKRLHMKADLIISSAADEYVFNRFGKTSAVVRGVEHFKFVFLQHGVTQNDISSWLNRYNKNIALVITASERERRSFYETNAYGYSSSQIACTGFPRHDKLLALAADNPPKKQVLIAPTWREYITGVTNSRTGKREENLAFENSFYFAFYNRLLNDEKVAKFVDTNGYSVNFLIHPALAQEAHKFTSNYANICTVYNYASEFVNSTILLTDYSSVAFDFALLKKPIIYAQADYEEFYTYHPWEQGYYEYDKDGFGPVCSTYEETVAALISYIANPEMEQVYKYKVDEFFYSPTTSRCSEVVSAIQAIATEQE